MPRAKQLPYNRKYKVRILFLPSHDKQTFWLGWSTHLVRDSTVLLERGGDLGELMLIAHSIYE